MKVPWRQNPSSISPSSLDRIVPGQQSPSQESKKSLFSLSGRASSIKVSPLEVVDQSLRTDGVVSPYLENAKKNPASPGEGTSSLQVDFKSLRHPEEAGQRKVNNYVRTDSEASTVEAESDISTRSSSPMTPVRIERAMPRESMEKMIQQNQKMGETVSSAIPICVSMSEDLRNMKASIKKRPKRALSFIRSGQRNLVKNLNTTLEEMKRGENLSLTPARRNQIKLAIAKLHSDSEKYERASHEHGEFVGESAPLAIVANLLKGEDSFLKDSKEIKSLKRTLNNILAKCEPSEEDRELIDELRSTLNFSLRLQNSRKELVDSLKSSSHSKTELMEGMVLLACSIRMMGNSLQMGAHTSAHSLSEASFTVKDILANEEILSTLGEAIDSAGLAVLAPVQAAYAAKYASQAFSHMMNKGELSSISRDMTPDKIDTYVNEITSRFPHRSESELQNAKKLLKGLLQLRSAQVRDVEIPRAKAQAANFGVQAITNTAGAAIGVAAVTGLTGPVAPPVIAAGVGVFVVKKGLLKMYELKRQKESIATGQKNQLESLAEQVKSSENLRVQVSAEYPEISDRITQLETQSNEIEQRLNVINELLSSASEEELPALESETVSLHRELNTLILKQNELIEHESQLIESWDANSPQYHEAVNERLDLENISLQLGRLSNTNMEVATAVQQTLKTLSPAERENFLSFMHTLRVDSRGEESTDRLTHELNSIALPADGFPSEKANEFLVASTFSWVGTEFDR